MGEYRFKRVDESCYKDLVRLYQNAFKQDTTLAYYQNKFNTDYLGVKHLGFLAYDEKNEPAAFYGVFPYMMEYKGRQYLAAQSGDTMTSPAHGGKGLFTTLAKMTYELAKQEGIQFIFGFPNENSYPGFVRKLNWTHKENITNYETSVLTFPCAAIAKKFTFLSPLHNAYTKLVLQFFKVENNLLNNSAISLEHGGVHRNADFFHYKSFYNNHLVSIGDSTAWIKVDGALLVGDIELKETNDAALVIQKLKRLAFWLGCNKIMFPVGKDTAWDILLKGKLQSKEGIYIGYLDLQSNLPLENFKFVLADFDTF